MSPTEFKRFASAQLGQALAHQATLGFLDCALLSTDEGLSQAEIARRCGERPQHFNRAVKAAIRGSGPGASLARVAKWVGAWKASGGCELQLVVTSEKAWVTQCLQHQRAATARSGGDASS